MQKNYRIPPQGELYRRRNGRWSLNELELTCGSHFQVNIQGHWIDVVMEHDGTGYISYPTSVRLHAGLAARFVGEYAE